MSSIFITVWVLFGLAALFASSAFWVATLVTSALNRRFSDILVLLAVIPILCVIGYLLPASVFNRVLIIGIILAAADVLLWFLLIKSRWNWKEIKTLRASVKQSSLHLTLLLGSAVFMLPFLWLISTSVKTDRQMSAFPPQFIPERHVRLVVNGSSHEVVQLNYQSNVRRAVLLLESPSGVDTVQILQDDHTVTGSIVVPKAEVKPEMHFAPRWTNYKDALVDLPPETNDGLLFLWNTLEVTALSIAGTLLSCSMVAYSFSRLKWPGRDQLFVLLLATMMLPGAVTMMPVFLIFRSLGWIDTLKPLWVPSLFASAFNVFLLKQFFLGIPTEIEDAAKLDGCSYLAIFWKVMMPQMKPALAAITIMTFMGAWNDFRGPLIYISSPSHETLAYALQLYQNTHGGEHGMMMAASAMVMIPVLAIFFFTQKYFIQGITLTGIKG